MSVHLLREFCAENFTFVPAAIEAGADRIELCDNLAVGGTTPSAGVIGAATVYAHDHGARVMTMIRPRGGDFVYSKSEIQMMQSDIETACRLGTDGIVLGCLKHGKNGFNLDISALNTLISHARWLQEQRDWGGVPPQFEREDAAIDITFHMAFDEIPASGQFKAIDELVQMGVTRILTHGGPAGTAIDDNIPRLKELIDYAAGRLIILPGAGITFENATRIANELGVHEVHGTKIVKVAR